MKKYTGILLFVSMLIVSLVSCGPSRGSSGETRVNHLERIIAADVLKVGVSLDNPPAQFRDDAGEPKGFHVDVAYKMAEELGVSRVEFVQVDGATRIPAVISGRIDVLIQGITGNLERSRVMAFSIPYLRVGLKMLTTSGSPFYTISDLNRPDARVVVARGTTTEALVLRHAPKAEMVYVSGFSDQVLHLTQGRADALLEDNVAVDYAASLSNGALVVRETMYTSDPICIGMPNDCPIFIRWVDMFVSWQISSGWMAETYQKWWGEPQSQLPYLW